MATKVNISQNSFGLGALRPEMYGRVHSKEAMRAVAGLENWDILNTNSIRKRQGFESYAQLLPENLTVNSVTYTGAPEGDVYSVTRSPSISPIWIEELDDGNLLVLIAMSITFQGQTLGRVDMAVATQDEVEGGVFTDIFDLRTDRSGGFTGSERLLIGSMLFLTSKVGAVEITNVLKYEGENFQLYLKVGGVSQEPINFGRTGLRRKVISHRPFNYRYHERPIIFKAGNPTTLLAIGISKENGNNFSYGANIEAQTPILQDYRFLKWRELAMRPEDYPYFVGRNLYGFVIASIIQKDDAGEGGADITDIEDVLFIIRVFPDYSRAFISMLGNTSLDLRTLSLPSASDALQFNRLYIGQMPHVLPSKYEISSDADYDNTLMSLSRIDNYAREEYNEAEGYPLDAVIYGSRKVEFRGKNLFFSWGENPLQMNNYVPSRFSFNSEVAEDLLDTNPDNKSARDSLRARIIPDPRTATEDDVYYYRLTLAELASRGSTIPFKYTLSVGLSNIQWVANHRGLVVGLKNRILRTVAMPTALGFTLPDVQTYDGAANSIIAQGEYNLFYVGAGGESVYGMLYDDRTKAGLRAVNLSMWGGSPGKVTGMFWNPEKNCLYVFRENLDGIDVLYVDSEYQVQGWGKYVFEGLTFVSGFYFQDMVWLIDNMGGLYGEVFSNSEGDQKIVSTVTFFKVASQGKRGDTQSRYFRVGKTNLFARNMTRAIIVSEMDDVEEEVIGSQEINHKFGNGVTEYRDLQNYVQGQSTILPVLEIKHTEDEPAEILSTESEIMIMEE